MQTPDETLASESREAAAATRTSAKPSLSKSAASKLSTATPSASPPGGTRNGRRETYTVAFRVDGSILSKLEEGAAAYGISTHEYARQRLLELLDRQDEARLISDVADVKAGLGKLREDLAVTLEVLLTNLTQAPPDQIRDWVDDNLRGD